MNIVYATNRNGALGCAVSARSALETVPEGTDVHIWVLDWQLGDTDRLRIAKTVRDASDRATISFIPMDPDWFKGLIRSRSIPGAAYSRLFLAEVLPSTVDRCVYLDIDTVCRRSVLELYETDLDGNALGAVPNGYTQDDEREQLERLGLEHDRYFGSGIMVCDIAKWRAEGVGPKAIAFARATGERLILHDQDALNGAVGPAWTVLPEHWNRWTTAGLPLEDCIVHYNMSPKPWHADYDKPGLALFHSVLDLTAYAGERPTNPVGLGALTQRVRRKIPYGPTVARKLARIFE